MQTAVLGATGLVGRIMLRLLEQRAWVDSDPLLLGSQRSAGAKLSFRGRDLTCHDAETASFAGAAVALFSAGAEASRVYAPRANKAGCWVVDNSSAFRMEPHVPLVVPEINPALVSSWDPAAQTGGIIANPNCSTIQIALALAPLQQAFGLNEVHVTTLQAVSGAGKLAVNELAAQVQDGAFQRQGRILNGELSSPAPAASSGEGAKFSAVFPRSIAFNVIPEIGAAMPDGSFQEEAKVVFELRKILDQQDLAVTCTATRVPVWNGHCAAVRVVLSTETDCSEAVRVMSRWPGLQVEASPHAYRTAAEASGDNAVHVGRLRRDPNCDNALLFWVVADNLLKGAALNAVQIAELLTGN